MQDAIDWIISRGKEPSTWAGLAGLAAAFGVSSEEWASYSAAIAAAFGALAVLLKERGK